MANLPPPHLHTARGIKASKKKFKFRWWMAVILVAFVAIAGIVVLRFSNASDWPADERAKASAGTIVDINFPSVLVRYPPYNYSRTFNALTDGGEAGIRQKVAVDLAAIWKKNHPDITPPATTTTSPTPTAPTKSSSGAKSNTPTTSSTSNATAPSADNSTVSTPQDSTDTTTTSSSTSSDMLNTATEDTAIAKDLGTLSGFVRLNFTPQNKDSVKVVGLVVNGTLVKVIEKSPYEFGFDSSQFNNGNAVVRIVVNYNDGTNKHLNYSAKFANSALNRFFFDLGTPWRFVFNE